ncbi:uncharacterized protein C8A04DRAFT_13678 [Dichotomopilus funicola]|uniref:Uncharacterized protein n=1 Tax=Dichotomopilus funicola TaxID=1934379 RepID=A0AAN6V024_9PEZI|nr:hypothetical protein C8A04DRAFT_13678 [Dichotomopilus funicola]
MAGNWNQNPPLPPRPQSYQGPYPQQQQPPPPPQPYYNPQQYNPQPYPPPNQQQQQYGYQQTYQPAPQHQPPQTFHSATIYPFVQAGHRQMSLLAPDRSHTLFTLVYPSTFTTSPRLAIYFGDHSKDPNTPELGGAQFHSFTTDKVDAWVNLPGGGGKWEWRFKKTFVSQSGLGGGAPGGNGNGNGYAATRKMKWGLEDKTVVLKVDDGSEGGGFFSLYGSSQAGSGPALARFVSSKGVDMGLTRKREEGQLEVIQPGGLGEGQFWEVVVTLFAEMERRRMANEEIKVAGQIAGDF